MEFINTIKLQGVVGASQISPVNGMKVARFSLMTEYTSNSKDGCMMVESTWFSVTAWEGNKITDLDKIGRGSKVHVIGRVRVRRFMDENGHDRQCWEVMASELNIVEE